MKSGILGTMAVLLAVGWAQAQPYANTLPPGLSGPINMQPGAYPVGPAYGPAPAGQQNYAPPPPDGGGGMIWYGQADFLLWVLQKGTIPSNAANVPVGVLSIQFDNRYFTTDPVTGALTLDSIQTIVGYTQASIQNQASFGTGNFTDLSAQCGFRYTGGFWLDEDMSYGLEGSAMFLVRGSDRFSGLASQPNNQFIIDTGFQSTDFLTQPLTPPTPIASFPVLATRQTSAFLVGTASSTLWGVEANARSVFLRIGGTDIGGLLGARYLRLWEELHILSGVLLTRPEGVQETNSDASLSLSQNLTINTNDKLKIWNHFYGGHVGVDFDSKFGSFYVFSRLKAGVGVMHQVALVNSFVEVVNNEPIRQSGPRAGSVTSPLSARSAGGLLAGPGDNGRHKRNRIAFVPECNLRVGYQFTTWLRGYVGYDYLYLEGIARPGTSTATNTLNTAVQVGATNETFSVNAPTFRFSKEDTWIQGVTFGVEAKF